jgi:hypothetical protein
MVIRFLKFLIVGIFSLLYIPLNAGLMKLQEWYLPQCHKDKVVYIAFAPIYWLYVGIVTAISYPYEMLTENLH